MEKKKSNTIFGECRCCLAKGNHRDLMKEHYFNGIREVYFDIFMETFNLYVSSSFKLLNKLFICCTVSLRSSNSVLLRFNIKNIKMWS